MVVIAGGLYAFGWAFDPSLLDAAPHSRVGLGRRPAPPHHLPVGAPGSSATLGTPARQLRGAQRRVEPNARGGSFEAALWLNEHSKTAVTIRMRWCATPALIPLAVLGIGLVVTVLAPRLTRRRGCRGDPLAAMRAIREAVVENERCPSSTEGLVALVRAGLLKKEPIDAWGSRYEYSTDGASYSLTSFGADRRPGGEDMEADIVRTFRCPPN
jgi:hypothetical protein